MKVLFINPKFPGKGKPWMPLGFMYLSSYLKKFDIKTKIIDYNIKPLEKKELEIVINRFKPEIIGIGGFSVQVQNALELGKIIKNIDKNITLIYGGVHFTFYPEDGLKYGDICIVGEGEKTLLDICQNFDKYKNFKGIIKTEKFIENLDEIPFPDYEAIEMEKYTDRFITGEKAISIMTGRGCPYNCLFCASPQLYKRKVRYHSLDYIMAHIKYLIENYNLKNLRIMDDSFALNKKRVLEFCDKIETLGFKLNMACLTNVNAADFEVFKRMKEVGFSIIAFGVESGNDEILKKINKSHNIKMARKGAYLAKKAGLAPECLFMIGNIGETKRTVLDSINFAKEINPPKSHPRHKNKDVYYNWFQYATPFPGSIFHNCANKYGKVTTKDFSKYTHDRPIFIPNGMTESLLIKLKILANQKCNNQNNTLKRLYYLVKKPYLTIKDSLLSA